MISPRIFLLLLGGLGVGAVSARLAGVLTDAEELAGYAASLNERLQATGANLPLAVPPGARPLLGLELTTHEGYVVGAARLNLVLFEDGRKWSSGTSVSGIRCRYA